MSVKTGLNPIIDEKTEVLILGSLPSDISLEKKEYYANPTNDFWKVMAKVVDKDLGGIRYKEKINILLQNKIGLWDVFHAGERGGSMDHNFKEKAPNDFIELTKKYPNLRLFLVAGKEAYNAFNELELSVKYSYIPSTSAANRKISIEEKANMIKKLIENRN